jgi:phage terminase small subunit
MALQGDLPRLQPPEYLDDLARALFVELVAACSPQHFTKSDVPLLASYCQATLLARQAVTKAAEDVQALSLWEKAIRAQTSLATKLRLTPSSRSDPKTILRQRPSNLPHPWEDV